MLQFIVCIHIALVQEVGVFFFGINVSDYHVVYKKNAEYVSTPGNGYLTYQTPLSGIVGVVVFQNRVRTTSKYNQTSTSK